MISYSIMSVFDSFDDIKEVLKFYSILIGNTSVDDQNHLFNLLKESVVRIDPDYTFDHETPPTAYEILLLVEKLDNVEPSMGCVTFESPEGYYDTTMEFTSWDPLNPVDDTQQFPDLDCVPTTDRTPFSNDYASRDFI